MVNEIIEALNKFGVPFKKDIEAKALSKFKGGGIIRVLALPSTIKHLNSISLIIRRLSVPFFIIGGASNLLVLDGGYSGLAISCLNIKGATVTDNILKAGSGEILSKLNKLAVNNSLTGLEYFVGIPGTLGGAIFMNAGAFGLEIKDLIKSVSVYDIRSACLTKLKAEELDWSYRSSGKSFANKIIVLGELKLSPAQSSEIVNKMSVFTSMRRANQPSEPSLGCAFKNNNGLSAGFLIDSAGLKGLSLNGATVSSRHANFIVNQNSATASDYLNLARMVKKTVYDRFSITLTPEFKMLGDEKEKNEYLDLDEK